MSDSDPGSPATPSLIQPSTPAGYVQAVDLQKPLAEGGLLNPEGWLGYQRVQLLTGDTYRDQSTVIIIPSRDKFIHHQVAESWRNMVHPMNQKCALFFCHGDEVGVAYNRMINEIMLHAELGRWKYVMTLESDNLQPQDAHKRLLETIEAGKYDGVSGLYWTKGDYNAPMAYGDPRRYAATGELDFQPRGLDEIRSALTHGHVMEVNGIAMGCSLYRMELFREIPQPWFVTVNDVIEGKGAMGFTQDLWFCKNARARGKRFAVDLRVRVGHMDLATEQVY